MYHYRIDAVPPSTNKYLGNSNNFNIYRRDKKQWEWLIKAAVGRDKPKRPVEQAVVQITYYFRDSRRRDPDNYAGKFLCDGLVKAGVLQDDSFKNIELVLRGRVDRKNPRVEITIIPKEG